jgi:hypothetical protein
MSRSFKDVLDDLVVTTANAAINLDEVPLRNKAGMGICKADAIVALGTLRSEYKALLAPRVASIWLSGTPEQQKKFAEVAAQEGETLTVSTLGVYERMASDIEPTIGAERQFGGTQLGHLLRSLENVAREAGASFLATPHLLEVVTVSDFAALTLAIRGIIVSQVGEKLNVLHLENEVLNQALTARYSEKVVPVVVLTSPAGESSDLRQGMFGGKGIDFQIPENVEPDKEMVLAVFSTFQKAIKKQ